jgi:hypothetical protein
LCAYLPAKFTPLVFATAAYYIAFEKCGAWGFLSVAVSLTLAFFLGGGFQSSFIFTAVLFAPYACLTYILRNIRYEGRKNFIIRAVCVVALFACSAVAIVLLAEFIVGASVDIIIEKIGWWAIIALFALFSLPTDFFFTYAMDKLTVALGKKDK